MSRPWNRYSVIPKVRNERCGDSFAYSRYAGATTMEYPKLLLEMQATPAAMSRTPRSHTASAGKRSFFFMISPVFLSDCRKKSTRLCLIKKQKKMLFSKPVPV